MTALRNTSSLLLLLGLAACQPRAEDTGADVDADGDGYPARYDCDDGDESVYPTAGELCDGLDNDCDSAVDEQGAADATTWYADGDGDGYGNPAASVAGCSAPPGFLAEGGDCDDRQPAASPGAAEVCDGIDNDCDGSVDEDAADAGTWYPDGDGDGYGLGAEGEGLVGCRPEGSYAGLGGDCDDTLAAIHPGAAEVCGDGLVNDCGGDEAASRLACAWPAALDEGDALEIGPAGGGSPGWSAASAPGDLTGDGYPDLLLGSPGGDAAFLLAGPLATDADLGAAWALAGEGAGLAVASGDLDGDGYAEVLVGSLDATWILSGPVTSGGSLLDMASAIVPGAGAALAVVDLDNLGNAELIVGDPGSGAVWIFSGSGGEDIALTTSGSTGGSLGATLAAAGDVDGDGQQDLLVGAPEAGSGAGQAWLALGPLREDLDLGGARATFRGSSGGFLGSRAGAAVAGLGDVDGDGYDDFAVGAPGEGFLPGVLGAWAGGADADLTTGGGVEDADLFTVSGGDGVLLGGDVSALPDLDGDGLPEVVVGTGYSLALVEQPEVEDGPGEAYLFYSGGGSGLSGALVAGDAGVRFTGPQRAFGLRVRGVGDLDADGQGDLFISSGQRSEESYLFLTPRY